MMKHKRMNKIINIIGLIGIVIMTFGCKSVKTTSEGSLLNDKVTAKHLIKKHNQKRVDFKTLQAKVKISYSEGNRSQSYTVNLRMENNKTIWINATLGLARAKITPERVQFYDKINNQYFDGNYQLLSDLLGVELDYDKVQNLLLGDALFHLNTGDFKASVSETSYVLSPKHQDDFLELFFLLNPEHFKMNSQQLYQPLNSRMLQIDYKAYQEIHKQILPENIHIVAVEDNDELIIDLEYKSVKLNENVRFPFKIPKGYKEIVLSNVE